MNCIQPDSLNLLHFEHRIQSYLCDRDQKLIRFHWTLPGCKGHVKHIQQVDSKISDLTSHFCLTEHSKGHFPVSTSRSRSHLYQVACPIYITFFPYFPFHSFSLGQSSHFSLLASSLLFLCHSLNCKPLCPKKFQNLLD